jgi:hypothetical protein
LDGDLEVDEDLDGEDESDKDEADKDEVDEVCGGGEGDVLDVFEVEC